MCRFLLLPDRDERTRTKERHASLYYIFAYIHTSLHINLLYEIERWEMGDD